MHTHDLDDIVRLLVFSTLPIQRVLILAPLLSSLDDADFDALATELERISSPAPGKLEFSLGTLKLIESFVTQLTAHVENYRASTPSLGDFPSIHPSTHRPSAG